MQQVLIIVRKRPAQHITAPRLDRICAARERKRTIRFARQRDQLISWCHDRSKVPLKLCRPRRRPVRPCELWPRHTMLHLGLGRPLNLPVHPRRASTERQRHQRHQRRTTNALQPAAPQRTNHHHYCLQKSSQLPHTVTTRTHYRGSKIKRTDKFFRLQKLVWPKAHPILPAA